jgi:alpha-ketoglutarate-dependent taurine dioxygenase
VFELGVDEALPDNLSAAEFRQHISTHGVVKIRGVTESQHLAITNRFGCNWSNFNWAQSTPWRTGPINKTGRIESAVRAVLPHSEYVGHPGYPQLLWLYCVEPARLGGETFVYDGMAVAREMPVELRKVFAGRHLKSHSQLPLAAVLGDYAAADIAELRELIRERGWEANMSINDALVTIEREWPAFTRHAESGAEIFCNSIVFNAEFSALVRACVALLPIDTRLQSVRLHLFNWLDRLPKKLIKVKRGSGYALSPTFTDGAVVPRRTVRALDDLLAGMAMSLEWQPGDLVVVDNHRFMHGRSRTEAGPRTLIVRAGDWVSDLKAKAL